MKYRDAGFILGAAFLAIVIAMASYFLLFSPVLAARADAMEAQEAAVAFNQTLEIQLIQKQAEAAKMPEFEEQIAEIATQLLPRDDLAQVRRDIDAIMVAEGVVVTVDAANPPVLVTSESISLASQAYTVGRVSYVEGLAFRDVYQTQMQLTLEGPYANIVRAIAKLQFNEGRYLLVSDLDIDEAVRLAPELPATFRIKINYFTLFDPELGIDPGSNSGNFDPDTGEPNDPPTLTDPLVPLIDPVEG
jgi:hypothetical protein